MARSLSTASGAEHHAGDEEHRRARSRHGKECGYRVSSRGIAAIDSLALEKSTAPLCRSIGILFEMEREYAHLPFGFAALRSGRTAVPLDSSMPVRAERRRASGGVEA